MSAKRLKVINIMAEEPPYGIHRLEAEPDIKWVGGDGAVIGIWKREWANALGEWVIKQGEYEWEIWQPDTRAEKIYTHSYDTGVVHKLFPAETCVFWPGYLRPSHGVRSRSILDSLEGLMGQPVVVLLHGSYAFWYEVLGRVGKRRVFPIILISHGGIIPPLKRLGACRHPLSFVSCFAEHNRMRKNYSYIDVIGVQNSNELTNLHSVYEGRVERITMGCDFEFWKPISEIAVKEEARRKLGIIKNGKVFLTASNFIRRKQIDRLIRSFSALSRSREFVLLVAGDGSEKYTNELITLGGDLVKQGKLIFYPYVTGERLRELYWSADLYVSASWSEGASVAVMKAFACSVPTISTPICGAAEVMAAHGAGVIIPPRNYNIWERVLQFVIDHENPPPLDHEIARKAFEWKNVAAKVHAMLETYRKNG